MSDTTMTPGTYRTAAGSTLEIVERAGGLYRLKFSRQAEGACPCCYVITAYTGGSLVWECDTCSSGGGIAAWVRVPESDVPA